MKTLNDFDFSGKRALIRVDYNVPLNDELEVTDNTRIEAAKPTIMHILNQGGSCVLMSHLGRPKAKESEFSLSHIVDTVSQVLGVPVAFVADCIGDQVENALAQLPQGGVLLLENLRYYPEEEQGDHEFAKALSKWGDIYVNDAFGTAHRAQIGRAHV